jgi:hypothetical protein
MAETTKKKDLEKLSFFQSLIAETGDSTLSSVYLKEQDKTDQFLHFIIENGYRKVKVPGNTRIPEGIYPIYLRRDGKHFLRYSQSYKHLFTIGFKDVPNFKKILVHIGNTVRDTDGCPLTVMTPFLNRTTGNFEGKRSTEVYLELYELIKDHIERNFGPITADNADKIVKEYNKNPTISWTISRDLVVPEDKALS